METYCMDCGALLKGRSDKRFCNDYCRSHHYHQVNKDELLFLKEINKILKKNKIILERFYTQGISALHRSPMLAAGFNFNYFTHLKSGHGGRTCIYCYEYGYVKLNEDEFLLCKQ